LRASVQQCQPIDAAATGCLDTPHESAVTVLGAAMRKRLAFLGLLSLIFNASEFPAVSGAPELYGAPPENIKDHLNRLVRSYPKTIRGYSQDFLLLQNGTKFQISDRRTDKAFQELLEKPDIDDMFYAAYPVGTVPKQPKKNIDPGRIRFEPLFVAMYGDCKQNEVTANLRTIEWLPKHGGSIVSITKMNGVDKALEAVSRDLDELRGDFIKYLKPTSGTYNCRVVAGTNYMSMHAYGAAIDLNAKYADYWRWSLKNESAPVWKNQIPVEIVRVFEKYGFIWGGYWYHYDTMHFEYRPEMFL
jgi:D-alanyl-D-alanine carboxypeptidase